MNDQDFKKLKDTAFQLVESELATIEKSGVKEAFRRLDLISLEDGRPVELLKKIAALKAAMYIKSLIIDIAIDREKKPAE
jgi:hypothetical protein